MNVVVKRQHFCCLEQEKDESINSFEDRNSFKALLCGFFNFKYDPHCKKCEYRREEDEKLTHVLCNMRDKDLQKELWRKEESLDTLRKVLGAIRTSKAAIEDQTAAASQAASGS